MRLFDGDPYSGHERLQRASPDFMDEVYEAQEIWKTEGVEFDNLRQRTRDTCENVLIRYATEDGVKQWEDWIDEEYQMPEKPDLDFRRAAIASLFVGQRHIGRPEILGMMRQFLPHNDISVFFDHGHVELDFGSGFKNEGERNEFLRRYRKKIPTHLGLWTIQHEVIPDIILPVTAGSDEMLIRETHEIDKGYDFENGEVSVCAVCAGSLAVVELRDLSQA